MFVEDITTEHFSLLSFDYVGGRWGGVAHFESSTRKQKILRLIFQDGQSSGRGFRVCLPGPALNAVIGICWVCFQATRTRMG